MQDIDNEWETFISHKIGDDDDEEVTVDGTDDDDDVVVDGTDDDGVTVGLEVRRYVGRTDGADEGRLVGRDDGR